jgi:hypothetical protein
MKLVRMLGLCLAAVLALSVVAASSASAGIPLFLFKAPPGGFPAKFKSHSVTGNIPRLVVPSTGQIIECTSETDEGTVEDAHLGSVTVHFHKCKEPANKVECNSAGAAAGEIVAPLKFHLGLEHDGTNTTIPAVLFLLNEGGKPEIKFECSFLAKIVVKGEVIALLVDLSGKPVTTGVAYSSLVTHFQVNGTGSSRTQKSTEFLLQLVTNESESLMTGVHLTSALNGGTANPAVQESEDAQEEYKDATGKAFNVEFELETMP